MFNKFLSLLPIIFAAVLVMVSSSCGRRAIPSPNRTLIEPVVIKRNNDGDYLIRFKKEGLWNVYTGTSPKSINWDEPLIAVDGSEVIFTQFDKSKRTYFGFIGPDNKRHIYSERRINMKGAPNFRDIGGFKTKDGRIVNWGMMYRSSKLSDLTEADQLYMQNLGIINVCDFRYPEETEESPNKLPAGVAYHNFPIGGKEGVFYQKLKRRVLKEGLRKEKAKKEFIKVMEMFADSAAHDFKPVMDMIADTTQNQVPLVYHCSGGKDRTGYMTMVILATLGVDKETIREDYLMSNFYRYKTNKKIARKASIIIDSETIGYILVVQDEYFDGVFRVIDEKYGGIGNYILEKYGITPEHRQKLIDKYTMPVKPVILVKEKKVKDEAVMEKPKSNEK